jgi:Predicted sulfurtransferase
MFHVFGFYKFKRLTSLKKITKSFQEILINNRVRGTIIFSKEGINGTISGKKNNIEKVKNSLKKVCKIKKFDSRK